MSWIGFRQEIFKERRGMARRAVRFISFVLVLVLLCTGICSAASASVISPSANSVVTGDSLLVSVKVSDAGKVRISVFREMIENVVYGTDGAIKERTYSDIDCKDFTSADLALISAGKTTDASGAAITLSNGTPVMKYADRKYMDPVIYENEGDMSFYTKQLSSVSPGLYKLRVEVLDSSGEKVTQTISSLVLVKEKPAEQEKPLFEKAPSGALQFIQNLLRSLFK